jgi:RNA polymerase sigma-70 factor (ECF subfamily)
VRAVEEAPARTDVVVTPEATAALTEQQRAVACALDALPADQRVLIEQAYFLGLTQAELAERFDLPLGTVKTRIRTGMLALREQLGWMFVQQ